MTDDETDAYERLKNIEETVNAIASENAIENLEPRANLEPGSKRHTLVKIIKEKGPLTSTAVDEYVEMNATSALSDLYKEYIVHRTENGRGKYEYELTDLGERNLETDQTSLDETAPEPDETNSRPWEGTGVNESQYRLLEIIVRASDSPRSSDVNETFVDQTSVSGENGSGKVVTPYLTQLFKAGYVDRTPTQPYRYWVTEAGKDVLEN